MHTAVPDTAWKLTCLMGLCSSGMQRTQQVHNANARPQALIDWYHNE